MSLMKRMQKDGKPERDDEYTSPAPTVGAQGVPSDSDIDPEINAVARQRRDELRDWMLDQLMATLDVNLDRTPDTRRLLAEHFQSLYRESKVSLSQAEQKALFQEIQDELLGFGPLESLLRNQDITEIMVNGPNQVYIEKNGKVVEADVSFRDDAHVVRIIERIVRPLGRRIDRKWPMVDARLPDGSRVNAVIPPVAIDGPNITIRKFGEDKLTINDLLQFGSLNKHMAKFLQACVVSKLNIVVSGGTGSGKTTLLNILSSYIPRDERIVTIEDSAELQLQQPHVVRLETKPQEPDGSGRPVHIRDLVINSLRMRPERIVVGECRGGEALDMLQAMNTGHDGSLTTAHANTPRDCLARLETMCLMAGMEMPLKVIREQIASAVDLIVQTQRLRDGSRKIINISEVQGMEGETIVMQDIFRFREERFDVEVNKVVGDFHSLGIRPRFTPHLEAAGFDLPAEMFAPSQNRRLY